LRIQTTNRESLGGNVVSKFLWSQLLLLFCVLVPAGANCGQTTNHVDLRHMGLVEYRAGHYERAETLLLSALKLAEQSNDDYQVAAIHDDLGALYEYEGRLSEAERYIEKALFLFKRMPDTTYEIALVLHNLAGVYSLNHRDSAALKDLRQALKLLKGNSANEQTLAAQILNGFGMVYFRKGNPSRAEKVLAQAMATRSAMRTGPIDVDAQILNNLGVVYQKQHRYSEAEESYKRSLEIETRVLGCQHPQLTFPLTNLGSLYTEMQRLSEAGAQYRRSLDILEKMSPIPHGRIVETLHVLAQVYLREGDTTGAESTLSRAVQIARRNPRPDLRMPSLLDAYADILRSLGKLNEAQLLTAEARFMRATETMTVRIPNLITKSRRHSSAGVTPGASSRCWLYLFYGCTSLLRSWNEDSAIRPLHERRMAARSRHHIPESRDRGSASEACIESSTTVAG
jgi:tetratricopeptide (TPR) repeat protein